MTGQLGKTQNWEVFAENPLGSTIPNRGVVKVAEPGSAQEWEVLRHELKTFVCEGEYQRGLERILGAYLNSLGQPTQPAVWVSGFFGSGKSHLVRVLEYLWRDMQLPDGATARGLVTLPAEIEVQLRELSTVSRREGGLWSAAGALDASVGDSIGLALLAIIFRSAGLPESYPAARLVLWLQREGLYDAVRTGVESAGRDFEQELSTMYVSDVLAESLLSAKPTLAADATAAGDLLFAQFPPIPDISDMEMVATLDEVLRRKSTDGKRLPCTLIVLDELQQFIGDNAARSFRVQQVVEACSSRLGSRLLIVATGQSAMQGTPMLGRLAGRFTVQVGLSDTDVTQVVRQVVLRKRPDREAQLEVVLEAVSGEIDRQLRGTKIEPTGADVKALVAEYPLLPARRRLWGRILRAIDRAGVAGQLRTQLELVHEATRSVAEQRLGWVVPADFIYPQLESRMQQSGVLLSDVAEIIGRQRDGTPDGKLRSRLCATIFLIGQLPRDGGADIGVRATPETLADLLVEDLRAGSAELRGRIPGLLADLLKNGSLMQVGEEYRLQTREGTEWTREYENRYHTSHNNLGLIADRRAAELNVGVGKELQGLKPMQGASKESRSIALHFGAEEPKVDGGAIPVWVRDEWSVTEKTVRQDAQSGGPGSPVIYVFLPRRGSDELRRVIAELVAATETLQARKGTVETDAGKEAQAGMLLRQREAQTALDLLIAAVLNEARVFQGGGSEVALGGLRASVKDAADSSLARLYPQFAVADAAKWDKVMLRARQGNGDALAEIGYTGEIGNHPVCQQIATYVGTFGKKGAEIRKQFATPPFGWPKDAVDGALLTLVAAGVFQAQQNGTPVGAKGLDQGKITTTEFRSAGPTVGITQRLAVRNLLQTSGVPYTGNEEALALSGYLQQMMSLAEASGGAVPAPAPPDTSHLRDLQGLSGNEALLQVAGMKDRLIAERLAWTAVKAEIAARQPRWQSLTRLLAHAQGLSLAPELTPQVTAIATNRTLLADPDPVAPLANQLTEALRGALVAAHGEYQAAFDARLRDLEGTETWAALTPTQRETVLREQRLAPVPAPQVGTEGQVLATLDETSLAEWANRTAALAERFASARLAATKLLKPEAVRVSLPSANLATPTDVDDYLKRVRAAIMAHIEAGKPVIV